MRNRSMALVVRNGKILMIHTYRFGRYIHELPGGGIEAGETPEEAAVRELREECGLVGSVVRPLNVLHRSNGNTEYVFLVDVSEEQKPIVGIDPEIEAGAEQAIKAVCWKKLSELCEKDRAFLWSYGLMDVEGFREVVLGWGDEVSYPGELVAIEKGGPMTKHMIIAGVPRAGKSMVSQMIAKKFGYQHISMDSIIAGFEKAFPSVGIDTEADMDVKENVQCISTKIAPFLRAMMDSGEYDECDYGMVIDVFQLMPEDYRKWIDPTVCEIFYFVTSDVTAEERFELLKKHDTPKDYTYYKSDEENRKACVEIVEISKWMKEQCEQYNLPCFETAIARDKVIGDFMIKF